MSASSSPAPHPDKGANAAPLPKIAPNAVEFRLGNGMDVVVIPDHRAPVVTHMVWYKVGAADEQPGQSGLAHFFEHLMFKGTRNHPEGRFSEAVSDIGGEENAFTTLDYTAYFQRVAKENLGEMMAFEADRMRHLTLADEQVATERDVVIEERRLRIDNDPGAQMSEQLARILYMNHPYGKPVIGWMHEIEALNRTAALDFYNRYYTPANAVLVVAGDVTAEEVRRLADLTYGQIAGRTDLERAPRPAEPPSAGARAITVRDEKVREPQVQRVYIVPSKRTSEKHEAEALTILAEILGGNTTSRFYDNLVRGNGPATYAGAYYQSSGIDNTRFIVYGVPKAGVTLQALTDAMQAEIARLATGGISDDELRRARNAVLAQAIYAQDSQQAMARIIGTALVTGSTLAEIQNWPSQIDAVSADDVRDVARRYLREDQTATGYLEPLAEPADSGAPQNGPHGESLSEPQSEAA
ncbi:zinc protease [Faunimonas pinastri]|uniref:Zinc protease n=1 Tax=Faunimonas pinastri TaxID=1855383 RepID=A0A1H8ZJX6_9HYPH|nr:pitrilysin family protein [Faunimonas pinastri]SEP64722.1 zinc protease [Faunimonas pinastri]